MSAGCSTPGALALYSYGTIGAEVRCFSSNRPHTVSDDLLGQQSTIVRINFEDARVNETALIAKLLSMILLRKFVTLRCTSAHPASFYLVGTSFCIC